LDGSTLNSRYEIVRSIGHGGAAIVYLGRDLLLNRSVAIKILRAQYASDPQYVARFQREAQSAASFAHPNIIDIYDVGEFNGSPFIVMEYIAGDTLKQIIENEGPFDPDDVASLIEQVAAGLDYAHARGIVHRDVKPQNILVTREGLAKVVDFGIAKATGESALTDAGLTIGTAHYISPEQASGLPATPVSDVYSLGIVAYEMLCDRLPFDAANAVAVAMMQVNQAPTPPDEVDSEVPPGAADIVLRSLEKDPTRRYPSAGAFAEALTNWRTGGIPPKGMMTQSMPSASPQRSSRSSRTERNRASSTMPMASQSGSPARQPARAPEPPQSFNYDQDEASYAAPLYMPNQRDRSNGTLWAGFFVIAALAVIVWIGGRVAENRDDNDPTPSATQTTQTTPTETSGEGGSGGETATQVEVPKLVGLSQNNARRAAEEAGLTIKVAERRAGNATDEDEILEQDPEEGAEVESGSTINVVLSTGPSAVDLSKLGLVGLPQDQVEARLNQLGFTPIIAQEASTDVEAGNVIRVDPEGEAQPGESVTVYVSMGDTVYVAPDLQGQPLDTVISLLENNGLEVTNQIGVDAATIEAAGLDLEASDIQDRDVVGIQDNDANFGVWLPRGTQVTLVYYDATQDKGD
jgi:serine/threonine-protein kinase